MFHPFSFLSTGKGRLIFISTLIIGLIVLGYYFSLNRITNKGDLINSYNSNQRLYWEEKCSNNPISGCWVDVYSEVKKNGTDWMNRIFIRQVNYVDKPQFEWIDSNYVKESQTGATIKMD